MSILKLSKGDRARFTVSRVEIANGEHGEQYKFVGSTPTDADAAFFMGMESAERQLGRIGLTVASVVGQTVEFAKPDKYIDINKANGTAPAAAAPTGKQPFSAGPHVAGIDGDAPTDAQATRVEQLKKLASLHKRCLQFVIDEEIPMLEKPKIGASPESVSALTAQLFIAATQAGLHR